MRWRKRNAWKIGIAITGILLLLLVVEWGSVSVVGANAGALGQTQPRAVTIQVTPTEDATVTALNKEKLQHENDWWWNYGAAILTSLISTLTLAAAGIFTVVRYFNDRRDTREKQEAEAKRLVEDRKADRQRRDDDRFQTVVLGLGKDDTRIGATVILHTFLQEGYEKFYPQIFDLAVFYLRLRIVELEEPPDGFSQALFTLFKDSYIRILGPNPTQEDYESLNASFIRLDRAYLARCDLKHARMRSATFRGASFYQANLYGANLYDADFSSLPRSEELKGLGPLRGRQTYLGWADLSSTNLRHAKLIETNLTRAKLIGANLCEADLSRAYLKGTDLSGSDLSKANLSEAIFTAYYSPKGKTIKTDLSRANLSGANLSGADLTGTHLEESLSLKGTSLHGVIGLTKEQLEVCKAKGAIIDEDPSTNPS